MLAKFFTMKRKLLFLAFGLTAVFGLNAQSIGLTNTNNQSIVDDTLIFWHAVDTTQFNLDFKHENLVTVTNNSSNTMNIDLIREELSFIPGTGDYFCWGTQCFNEVAAGSNPTWIANDPVNTAPNATAGGIGFSIYFAHKNTKVGEALHKFTFTDLLSTPAIQSSLFVRWSLSYLTTVDEIALNKSYQLYPNPAEDQFTVDFDQSLAGANNQVLVFNLLGEEMARTQVAAGQGKLTMQTANLAAGVYFVNLVVDGKMIATKKLTIR